MSPIRGWVLAAAGVALLMVNTSHLDAGILSVAIDCGSSGVVINNGVRGQCPSASVGSRPNDLTVCYNTCLRGIPSGALDSYDWRNNHSGQYPYGPQPTTLDVLRELRDRKSWGVFTVNARGFGRAWFENGAWKWQYNYNCTDLNYRSDEVVRLGSIARQWVHYVNCMVQKYRLNQSGHIVDLNGSPVTLMEEETAIYNSITWEDDQGKPAPKLLRLGELAVPKITYWEIGNEPEWNGPVGHWMSAVDYSYNYRYIRGQMLQEDITCNSTQTIKTGPVVMGLVSSGSRAYVDQIRSDGGRMEFLAYHPYYMTLKAEHDQGDIPGMQNALRDLKQFIDWSESYADDYLNATCTALIASEHNPSTWELSALNNTMAHALGVVESVFSFAGTGILAATYWNMPSMHQPSFRAWEKLQSELGDRLVYSNIDDTNFFRLYATKSIQSNRICIWALNFSDTLNRQVNFSLLNVPAGGNIKLMKLGNMGGDTSLMSTSNIGWSTTNLSGQIDPGRFSLTFEDATVSVLVIEPPSTKPAQPDVTGLLTRVWGSVSYIDSVDRFLYLDDGSGVYDGNPGGYKGVRISWELAPDLPLVLPVVGQSVSAAGIASRVQYGSGAGRVVLLRTGRELVIH